MAQHEVKAIDRIGMQTIGIFGDHWIVKCGKQNGDGRPVDAVLILFSIGLLYHESQGLWYYKNSTLSGRAFRVFMKMKRSVYLP